jgi:hypothetical protein
MMNPKTQRTIVIGLVLAIGLAMVVTMIAVPS